MLPVRPQSSPCPCGQRQSYYQAPPPAFQQPAAYEPAYSGPEYQLASYPATTYQYPPGYSPPSSVERPVFYKFVNGLPVYQWRGNYYYKFQEGQWYVYKHFY